MQYITIKKAAKLLHVTPLTLRNWDKKGILKPYRHPVNNYRIYKLDQIEMLLRKIELSKSSQSSKKIDVYL